MFEKEFKELFLADICKHDSENLKVSAFIVIKKG